MYGVFHRSTSQFSCRLTHSLDDLETPRGLDSLIEHGSSIGVKEFVMGMAHRGRLNVLANIFNKTYKEIFSEFEGNKYEDDTI